MLLIRNCMQILPEVEEKAMDALKKEDIYTIDDIQICNFCPDIQSCHLRPIFQYLRPIYNQISQPSSGGEELSDDDAYQGKADIDFHIA